MQAFLSEQCWASMHKRYFPPCPVKGPIDPPLPYGHFGSNGAVPNKCRVCKHLFEGECTRCIQQLNRYMHLDHGPCGISGPTDPVQYENEYMSSKVEIPRKCVSCVYLDYGKVHGFYCSKDKDKWGDLHRGLDWDAWAPDKIYLELPPPKITTRELSEFVHNDDLLSFISEYRRVNPGLSIQEAKADFHKLRHTIKMFDCESKE